MKSRTNNPDFVSGAWLLVSFIPLLIILAYFVFGHWTWGMMDDHALALQFDKLNLRSFIDKMPGWFCSGRGLRFTYDIYTEFFYYIFNSSPKLFYIFHALYFYTILLMWGYIAYLLTKEKLALLLVPAIAFGSKLFYEGFFYLSLQELLGLFFLGSFLIFIIRMFIAHEENRPILYLDLLAAGASFILTVGSKETFVGPLVVVSIAFFIRAIFKRWVAMAAWMAVIFIMTVSYALWLKFFIQKSYTSSYKFHDLSFLWANAKDWFSDVFVWHLPWISLSLFFLWFFRKEIKSLKLLKLSDIVFGLCLYLIYWLLILPWRATSYFSIPLAVFFALSVSVALGPILARLKKWGHILLTVIVLLLNIYLTIDQTRSFEQYNHDTWDFIKWMDNDPFIKLAQYSGKHFGCNGEEPAAAISNLVKLINKKEFPVVLFTPNVWQILDDQNMFFYFYLIPFGDQDLRALGKKWETVFVTKNWIVFKRDYY